MGFKMILKIYLNADYASAFLGASDFSGNAGRCGLEGKMIGVWWYQACRPR
jgi:hypothetical protein